MAIRTLLCLLLLADSTAAPAQEAEKGNYLKDPGQIFILENARVIDGTGAAAQVDMTVVVDKGLITFVGKAGAAPAPAAAKRIDLARHTILPGLVMMHEHMNYFSGAFVWDSMPGSVPKLLLAAGVTSARTAGSEAPQVDMNLKARIDAGKAAGPRLFVTGAYLNGPSGGFLGDTVARTAEEARDVTAFWGSRGATSMKVYSSISPEALRGATAEANRRGMHVAGHLGEIGCAEAAEAGLHTIEHGLTSCLKDFGIAPDAIAKFRYSAARPAADRLIATLVNRGVTMVSTAAVEENFEPSNEEIAMLSPDQLARYREFVRNRPPWFPPLSAMPEWNPGQRAFEGDFVAAGGRLLVGGDASDFGMIPGYANHNAMIALVRGGFTPLQVIKFATSDAATFLKSNRFGAVAPGKTGDLLIVRGKPDERIEDIRNVVYVFKDGRAYDPKKLRDAARGQLGLH